MTTSLIDSVKNLATPDLTSKIASSLGEPMHGVSSALLGGLNSMLLGILGKTADPTAMRSVFNIVTDPVNDGRVLDNPADLVGAPEGALSSLGGQLLSNVLGARGAAVNDVLARLSGLRSGSISSLMRMAAPLLLGVLGKRARDGGLNASSFTRLFEDEREGIENAAPPGVAGALGLAEPAAPSYDAEASYETRPADQPSRVYAPEEQTSGVRWLWPALVALAAIALFLGTRARHRTPAPVADTTTARARTAGGTVAELSSGITQVKLPNGNVLTVPGSSAEAKLVAFLNDSTRALNDTSWIVLDRVHFESNSSKIDPDAENQAKNVSDILKAYPHAVAKIGGYTDSTGSDAANLRLSRERAESAVSSVEHNGLSASRIMAEGFGSKNPVADNSTDDGKAQNRRVALLVITR
ncbi:MAG TPA: OmpA family protein [Gemmatimonadaceae bacterium]|nr:OmpA family protein [Gemmatimonadaceae bacterium]